MVSDTPVKIGRPYQVRGRTYVPADDAGYDEVGYASWYGPGQGGRTANGEKFKKNRVGAAHRTLPLPSYVEVTALATGRRIIVRVNDRGPFVDGRIIDLSLGAAEELGIVRSGTARVRVRRVFPGEQVKRALRSGRAAEPLPSVPPTR
jgi:rare lipoprotein A